LRTQLITKTWETTTTKTANTSQQFTCTLKQSTEMEMKVFTTAIEQRQIKNLESWKKFYQRFPSF